MSASSAASVWPSHAEKTIQLLLLDFNTARYAPAAWPAEWNGMRERLLQRVHGGPPMPWRLGLHALRAAPLCVARRSAQPRSRLADRRNRYRVRHRHGPSGPAEPSSRRIRPPRIRRADRREFQSLNRRSTVPRAAAETSPKAATDAPFPSSISASPDSASAADADRAAVLDEAPARRLEMRPDPAVEARPTSTRAAGGSWFATAPARSKPWSPAPACATSASPRPFCC